MTLEQQVCSLDLAKQLKELGVPQRSIFFWERDREMRFSVVSAEDLEFDLKRNNYQLPPDLYCSAFTVSELGLLIPKRISDDNAKSYWPCYGWIINLELQSQAFVWWEAEDEDNSHEYFAQSANTEADARAKMLIYLLENKLINLPTGGALQHA